MIISNFHTHTVFCDGKNTAEEMVNEAIARSMPAIGFSGHSYTPFDGSYCMKKDEIPSYISEIRRLKIKYADKINIYCGCEEDYYSDMSAYKFDYLIGSVHYLKAGNEYIPVDSSAKTLTDMADRYFCGDISGVYKLYFETVSDVIAKTNADIIGHFDLISKFNENDVLFNSLSESYIRAWQKAADTLIAAKKPFEVNTGAIARGYRTLPYPSQMMIDYIDSRGGTFILTSDCHNKENLCCYFDEALKMLDGKKLLDFEKLITG